MLLDASNLAIVGAVSVAAGIVGSVGGFGTGILLTAALTPLIGVKAVVPVLAVASVLINIGRFWFYRASFERRTVFIAVGAALPFLVLGTWIFSLLDARTLGTVLGLTVLATVPGRRILARRRVKLNTAGLAVGAGIYGFATGVASGTGMILVSVLLGAGLAGPAVLATDALASIALDLCKAVLFQRFSLLDADAIATGLVIGAASVPGSAVGAWLVNRIHAHLHVFFMEGLIVFGGVFMLWHSWR